MSDRASAPPTSSSPPTDADQPRTGGSAAPDPNRWITLVAVCLGIFMLLLDVTVVNVALPDIQQSLNSSFSDLQWVVDAYALTLAALLLTTGSLADRYGRRRLYAYGLVLFTAASLLCGLSVSPLMLELSRGAQGIGGAAMFAVSLALLANAFRGKERGTAFGIWGAVTGVAVAIGPLLGGVLTSGLSWRWIFFINLPVGIIALAMLVKVNESRDPQAGRPDWAGVVLFSGALACLVYGLIEAGRSSFTDVTVLALLIVAAVLLGAFLVLEARSDDPMLDLGLLRVPTFSGGLLAAFGVSAGLYAMLLYLVLYLQNVLGFSALGTGVRLLVLSGATFVLAAVAGRLSSVVPVRWLVGPGLILVGVGLLLMRGLDASSSWTHLILGLAVAGAGAGMLNPPLASTAVGVVEPRRAGMASGINSTFRQVGIATGIALLGTLFANRVAEQIAARLAGTPASRMSGQIAGAVQQGQLDKVLGSLPQQVRETVGFAARAAFTDSLNHILLVAGIGTLVTGVSALLLIRQADFVDSTRAPSEG